MKLRSIPPELRGELASLAPLPETAGELKAIAQIYGESNSLLLLNQNATQRALIDAKPSSFQSTSNLRPMG